MSELTLNHTARLTDALERDLLRGALENQPNAHPLLEPEEGQQGSGRWHRRRVRLHRRSQRIDEPRPRRQLALLRFPVVRTAGSA